jgi:hypothetical protein
MKLATWAVAAATVTLTAACLVISRPARGQAQQPAGTPLDGQAVPLVVGQQPGNPFGYGVPQGGDPEMEKLLGEEAAAEREATALVDEYARTPDEEKRAKIRAKLSAALEKQFDLQQKRRDLEVTRVEEQLKKLRDLMRKRRDSRQAIIDHRLDQILRDAEGLGWTAPPGTPRVRGAGYGDYAPRR